MLKHIPFPKKPLRPLIAATFLAILAGCNHAVLNPAGDIARQQRDIIYISTGLMLLIIVPVMILICVFAWRYRKGSGATYDPKFHHSTSLELVIWATPLLIIIALGALTWSSTHLLDPFRPLNKNAAHPTAKTDKEAPMKIQVVSLDWKWLFIYPEQNIATVNELVMPVDREVRFDITSSNMMNTFYAPTLAGMIYAMPGMQSTLHAVLNRPGEYEGMSANYSGAGFSDMKFKLRGVDEAGFNQWVAQARGTGPALDQQGYRNLLKPSEKVPVMYFSSAPKDLFARIVERCVEPGQKCMSEMMDHGGMGLHSGGNKPPAATTQPVPVPGTTPAADKAANDNGAAAAPAHAGGHSMPMKSH